MPAFVNSRFGESGMRLEDGTMVCCFDLKKSRNDWRIWVLVIMAKSSIEPSRTTALKASWKFLSGAATVAQMLRSSDGQKPSFIGI